MQNRGISTVLRVLGLNVYICMYVCIMYVCIIPKCPVCQISVFILFQGLGPTALLFMMLPVKDDCWLSRPSLHR